ncbi:hypothetical protein [Ideonella sp. BN130291]|uniref:hypothetical protein n=1 Tax=Ideonella sp. BN130291 TaxID=3112940 RepID=UPI002E25C1CB|nr:hypothetical protein [Ideonella sp. BN130291]
MTNRNASSFTALALSVVVTVAVLLGIDTLAVQEHAATDMAAAAAQAQTVAVKAAQPRS